MLIDKLDFEKPFTAEEFIQCDREEITTEMISNEEILKTVLPNNNQEEDQPLLIMKLLNFMIR
ncbi:hypothetical protein RirG_058670 [Rhizophagus irregularis DAOM 197198w]|uniref:Uncharacterized protein n=1 Tax=Rhizophagus irregularis (strain DAOM 197198w) TaxID=1432141 RepID=A0A015LLT0_RHIIW|nr:hypothetical protein RirG_058670 [Rhizophagus irregularis DAOM 197198w]